MLAGLFTGVFAALAAEEEVVLVFGLGGQQIGLYARDAGGDHLDRWNLKPPTDRFRSQDEPSCRDAGRVFRVYVRTLWYLCVDKSRFNVTCLDIVEFFFFSS